jgi:very-short-patch-repair endonuclease
MAKRVRGAPSDATELARDLRRRSTDAEQVLWEALRGRKLEGHKFRRQHPLGPYVVDFWCPEHALVVELDGPIHDQLAGHDPERTAEIESHGYQVVRFRNDDVLNNLDSVLQRIRSVLRTSPLSQSWERGRG